MGYAYERQSSLGEPAWPTYIWGIAQFAALILFVFTLYFVVKRNKKYLITASLASIAGYLATRGVGTLLLESNVPLRDLTLQELLSWAMPMIVVSAYRASLWIFVED